MSEIKQINTGVAELLAVKVPEGAHSFTSYRSSITDTNKLAFITTDITCIEIPPCNWIPLGLSTELTEEQCKPLIRQSILPLFNFTSFEISYELGTVSFSTAKEAFASLMQANGCYSVNPLGEKPERFTGNTPFGFDENVEALNRLADTLIEKWQQAEANTGTWLILKRLS